jgi:hypothetical protein
MTPPTRLVGALAVTATAASLAIPSAAGARAGDRTFPQTYPAASQLCTEVAASQRKRLRRFAPRILADCTALETGFTAAQSAVVTARTTLGAALAADQAAITAACPKPMLGHPACARVRNTENAAIDALQHQRLDAIRRYWRTVETNRRIFWNAIHALPGERHLKADLPIVGHDN